LKVQLLNSKNSMTDENLHIYLFVGALHKWQMYAIYTHS
jgi:hypothetical protein